MERSALIGGLDGASCILGAKLSEEKPQGTIPHTVMIISGDTKKQLKLIMFICPKMYLELFLSTLLKMKRKNPGKNRKYKIKANYVKRSG